MDVLVTTGQLILSLSILIVLHEMGHFFPAKFFNTKVEKFYLFFDPWFELFKIQKGETEYGIGWLPLGGYVKIAGMIDESFDTEQMQGEPEPWEFRAKPAWQRLVIMIGGVTVNFVLGFILFSMVLFVWGEKYLPTQNAHYGVAVDSLGQELGLMSGDKVLAVGDYKMERLNAGVLRTEIIINDARKITVERNGSIQDIQVPEAVVPALSSYDFKDFRLYNPRVPFVIGGFTKKDSPAKDAGFTEEDQIIALNGESTPYFDVFFEKIKKLSKPEMEVAVTAIRTDTVANTVDTLTKSFKTNVNGFIGASPVNWEYFYEAGRKEYSLGASIPAGIKKGWDFLGNQVKAFGKIASGGMKASDSLGSFISIGKMFGTSWDWERFWFMTAMLSLILAFINLLPIPALDGGHVMFLLYEVISGRKPSDKFMEYATMGGFILLLILMVYAIGLDISRLEFIKNLFN
ncbi:RIP metalloprotease RseP [bacterium]|jgi:regulator of sigma E protease|nr:RIP metalloprotease RseP [Bacteroidota bacterium]MDA7625687.1 RIP metalloprotease RseP [bacterium]MDF1865305.1 RIP metalloprotease RseP [Saprospiraceae bacterium]